MKKLWMPLCAALFAVMGNTQAATYFVSTSGSDANNGSSSAPWKTLQTSVNKLLPGDTLYLVSGTYHEGIIVHNAGTAGKPVTIASAPGQPAAVIDGTTLTVKNTTYTGAVPDGTSLIGVTADYVTISGLQLQNIQGSRINASQVTSAFGIHATGANVTIDNVTVHNIWSHGILIQGDNSTVQNSTIYQVSLENCHSGGTNACGSDTASWSGCLTAGSDYKSGKVTHHATLKDNTVYNCWGEGISTYLSAYTTIEDNVSYDNWAENVYINNATYALVQRNLVYNTPNNAVGSVAPFSLADELTDGSVTNTPSSNNTIIDNLVFNCSFSAFAWTLADGTGLNHVVIANNTFVDPYAFPDPNTHAFNTGSGSSNNITIINTASQIFNNIVSGTVYVPSSTGITFQSNLWNTSPPSTARGTGDVIGDPLLTATGAMGPGQLTGNYFELQSTSPAIGKASSLPAVTVDYFTTASAAPPDIGATETVAQDTNSKKP